MQRHLLAFYKVVEQRDNAPLNTFNILLLLNTVYQLDGMLIFFKRPQQCLLMMGSPETVCQKLLKYTFRWRRVLQEKIDPRHTPVIPKTPLSTNKPVKMKKTPVQVTLDELGVKHPSHKVRGYVLEAVIAQACRRN